MKIFSVATFYHVTPSVNRESISRHGLDWRRGGGGIAGSTAPEQEGVFLARDSHEIDFFLRIGTERFAALDVWEVTLDEDGPLAREFHGFLCWMQAISPAQLRLVKQDLTAAQEGASASDTQSANGAFVIIKSERRQPRD